MPSFNVLSKETPIFGNFFLEASAGTGKTFTIEHLVIRFLLESDVTLGQILVVTFTRAACRELKMRIYSNLKKVLQNPRAFEYLKQLTLEQKEKLEIALLTFEEASIFTIHGFCQKMLQAFAFEIGLGFQLEEWTKEEEKKKLIAFFRQKIELDQIEENRAQVGLLFKKYRHDFDKILEEILKREGVLRTSFKELMERLNISLKAIAFFPLKEKVQEALQHYKKMTDPVFLTQAVFLEEILKRGNIEEKEVEELMVQKTYFLEGMTKKNLKVKSKDYALDPSLAQVCMLLMPILEEMRNTDFILDRLAYEWKQEKKRVSRAQDKLSPDDLLEKMQEGLLSLDFQEAIRAKYQIAIVDEFQDTDPVQWAIFETLFLKQPMKAVYLVGDPKQSIYAFRKADIYTFLKASKNFSQIYRLDTNFRSEQGLVSSLNRLFCHREWIDLPLLGKNLEVLPVKAAREGEGKLHFMVAEKEKGRQKKWPSFEMEQELFFPFILHEIQRQNLELESVAILVKDRFQAQRVFQFLQKWNCLASIQRGESLADSCAFQALQELLEAVIEQDKTAMKKALLGELIGVCEKDLLRDQRELFVKLKKILEEKGFAIFWAHFLETKWNDSDESIQEKMVSMSDLRFYHDILEIVQKILENENRDRLLSFLEELKESEISDRVLGGGGGIKIMTIHASKGLEFETVFALGVASRTVFSTPQYSEEEDAEKMRQLYVALTRAKKRLYIPLAHTLDQEKLEIGEASPIELFWQRTKPILSEYEHTFLNGFTFSLKPFASKKETLLEPFKVEIFRKENYLLSFSSLARMHISTKDLLLISSDILPIGKEAGVILHRIFERVLSEKLTIQEIVKQEIKSSPLETWQERIEEMVEKTLTLSFPSGFCLKDISREKMRHEMEFMFCDEKGSVKGFIDLFFEQEGKYYLLDWKSNYLKNYDTESLTKAMQEGDYFLQISIYKTALQKYLKIFDSRPFKECFGGVFYMFVRGPAFFHCL